MQHLLSVVSITDIIVIVIILLYKESDMNCSSDWLILTVDIKTKGSRRI